MNTDADDDDDLLGLVSDAFEENLPPIPDRLLDAALSLRPDPAGPDWVEEPDGVVPGALRPGAQRPGDPPRSRYRLERHLAMAAAGSSRRVSEAFASSDGTVTTKLAESAEGRLWLSISSDESEILYVSLAWRLSPGSAGDPAGGEMQTLVTPLAPPSAVGRGGVSVGYDLGLVGSAEAIEIEPAEPMSLLDVSAEALEPALSLPQTGSTRRAWARAALMHELMKDPVAEVIWARFGP